MPDPTDERVKAQREESEQLERCYSRLFKSPDGQTVIKDLLTICYVEESTYTPGCTDAMLINEGCRRVFLRIIKKARMDVSEMYLNRDTMPGKAKKKRIPKVEIE